MQHPKALAVGVLTLALSAAASATASAQVQLTIHGGRASLVAKDATLRQILAEWAKVGQTKIINGDRVPGAPLTLQFSNLPEQQALEMLLRGLSGFVAQTRDSFDPTMSRFDRIVVMATIVTPVTAVAGNNAPPPPVFQQPNPPSLQQAILPDDEEDPAPNRGPMFNTFPQPQVMPVPQGGGFNGPTPGVNPGAGMNPAGGPLMTPPLAQPSAQPYPGGAYPGGVSVPGMIVPVPQPPGQPPPPGQSAQQPRRPGGNP